MAEYHGAKNSVWGRFLIVWALVLLLLGGAGCYLLYQYLGVYEVTRPDPVMDDFIKNTDLSKIIDMAKEDIPFELTEFEDPRELYTSYTEAIDLNRALNYRVNSDKSEPEHMVYDVRSGPNLICEVFLEPDGDTPGFSRNYWSVSGVQAAMITDLLPSITAQVETVSGTELSLNGVPLTDDWLSGKPKAIEDLVKYEAEMETPPQFLTYEVGPLYGEITLTDSHGSSLAPEGDVRDGRVVYQTFQGKQDLTITAPEDLPAAPDPQEGPVDPAWVPEDLLAEPEDPRDRAADSADRRPALLRREPAPRAAAVRRTTAEALRMRMATAEAGTLRIKRT